MSKYFNSTLKARSGTAYDEILKPVLQPEAAENPPAELAPAENAPISISSAATPPVAPAADPLAGCSQIVLPLDRMPHAQFRDGNSLEPAEESYRALRTRLLRAQAAEGIRSVVITSALQGDGKTLTSLNLAMCCAQLHGMKILLVDGDVRNCGLTRAIDVPPGPGLAEVLAGQCDPKDVVLQTDRPNLYIVPSGVASTAPAELFASNRWHDFMAWSKQNFKLVVVDSPPVLSLSDVELITTGCEGVLMVVRARYTNRQTLQKAAKQIDTKKLLGVVYNGVQEGSHHRYRYPGYGQYRKG